jgi:hypothetical protein
LALDLDKIGSNGVNKRAKDFPSLHDDNIDKLITEFSSLESTNNSVDQRIDDAVTRIDVNEVDISNILNRVGLSEQDILALQTQLPSISAGLSSRIDLNASDISTLQTNLNAVIASLQAISGNTGSGDVDTSLLSSISGNLQSQIDTNQSQIDTNQSNIASLDAKTTSISAEVTQLKQDVESIIDVSISGGSFLGFPTDGTFSDGVLANLSPSMTVADAVDDINEFLLTLSPSVPSIDGSTLSRNTGETGKLSFGPFNILLGYNNAVSNNTNDTFNTSGTKAGIFDDSTTITGNLANGVTGTGFDNNAFSDGDKGDLILYVNGSSVGTVDLESTTSAIGYGAGSGFSVSEVKNSLFESGSPSPITYRTGTYRVLSSSLVKGSNTIHVEHVISGNPVRTTLSFELIVDDNSQSMSIVQGISGLSMGGVVQLSGVKYHTSGTIDYYATIQNAYKHTYSTSNITHPTATRLSSVPSETLPGVVTNSSDEVSIDQTINISTSSRILNQGIVINTRVPRTLSRTETFGNVSGLNLLVDPYTNNGSSNTVEDFNSEKYRMYNGGAITTNESYSSGSGGSPYTWNSNNNMALAGNEQNGLIFYNGALRSPLNTINGGDFSSVTNGPVSNANYSGMGSGNPDLTFYRFFFFGDTFANFNMEFASTGCDFGDSISGGTPGGADGVKVEAMIPGSGGGYATWYDCRATQSNGGIYGDTYGSTPPTDWGISFPGSNTAVTQAIVVRVTTKPTWTGNISSISITGLAEG